MQDLRVFVDDALYVSGTVNGVDKVWTRESGNWWTTQADKSENGAYEIALSIVYGDGKTVSDSITIHYGLNLITDRTQSDVANGTKKGYYNAEDLNRVDAAVAYIRDRLNENGYDIKSEPYASWKESDIPTKPQMQEYLDNVEKIRDSMALPAGTPVTPETMERLNYIRANDIEKILETVDRMLTNSIESVWFSGELYLGEVI